MGKYNYSPAEEKIIIRFLELMKLKSFAKIKASEIIRLAEVNRSTFYRNFTDINDLYSKALEFIFNRLYDEIIFSMEDIADDESSMMILFDRFVDIIGRHREGFTLFTGKNARPEFLHKMLSLFTSLFEELGKKFYFFRGFNDKFPAIMAHAVILATVSPDYEDDGRKYIVEFDYPVDYDYDFEKDLLTNIDIYCRNYLKENGDLKLHLYHSIVSRYFNIDIEKNKFSVSKLAENSFVSRQMFYLAYKSSESMTREFASITCAVVVSLGLKYLAMDKNEIDNLVFQNIPENLDVYGLVNAMGYENLEEILARMLIRGKREIFNSERGKKLFESASDETVEKYKVLADYHLSFLLVTTVFSIADRTINTSEFKKIIDQIRDLMGMIIKTPDY